MKFNTLSKSKSPDDLTLAVDVGGSFTKFAVINNSLKIIQKWKIRTKDYSSFESLALSIKHEVSDYAGNLTKIGIGAPNVCANKKEIIGATNLGFSHGRVSEVITNLFNLPFVLENDANTAAIGEKTLGVAKSSSDFIVITIGTGIGSGIYLKDSLVQGGGGVGAELGHVSLRPSGRLCSCGLKGHVEAYLSCPGIVQTHKEDFSFSGGFSELSNLFLENDKNAINTVTKVAKDFALVCANMNALLSPELIIFAGGGSILGESFLDLVKTEYTKIVYPNLKNQTELILSNFTPEYGAIMGAYSLVADL